MLLFAACKAEQPEQPQQTGDAEQAVETQEEGPNPMQAQLMQAGFQVFKEKVEAPDFTLSNLNGEKVALSSFRGKVVLLNFWATWCPPCRSEMPSMQAMYNELRDEGVEIVAVNLQEPEGTVTAFLEENGYDFPVLLDSGGEVGAMYGARSIPTTYLLDTGGSVVAMVVGAREWESDELYGVLRSITEG